MLLKAFLDYLLLEKKYSELTVKAYKKDIQSFLGFLNETSPTATLPYFTILPIDKPLGLSKKIYWF